jgi:hypothetical protein
MCSRSSARKARRKASAVRQVRQKRILHRRPAPQDAWQKPWIVEMVARSKEKSARSSASRVSSIASRVCAGRGLRSGGSWAAFGSGLQLDGGLSVSPPGSSSMESPRARGDNDALDGVGLSVPRSPRSPRGHRARSARGRRVGIAYRASLLPRSAALCAASKLRSRPGFARTSGSSRPALRAGPQTS